MIRENFLELCLSDVTCQEFISAQFCFFLAQMFLWNITSYCIGFFVKVIVKIFKKLFKSKGDKK